MSWFGKPYGAFTLLQDDFLQERLCEKIKQADIIFVNNFAFGTKVRLFRGENCFRWAVIQRNAFIESTIIFVSMFVSMQLLTLVIVSDNITSSILQSLTFSTSRMYWEVLLVCCIIHLIISLWLQLNQSLKEVFSECKEGCRIISSLNFSPLDFSITQRNLYV